MRIAEGATCRRSDSRDRCRDREDRGLNGTTEDLAQIIGRLTVPIYQGGEAAANVRQFKETLGQRRIDLDSARAQVRQAFVSAWGQLDAARAQVTAAEAQVSAQQLVLTGVIEERRVGQRTTLDVLNAQQDLLDAQVRWSTRSTGGWLGPIRLLSAYGKLDARTLGLAVDVYDPTEHFDAVRDKWGGLTHARRTLSSGEGNQRGPGLICARTTVTGSFTQARVTRSSWTRSGSVAKKATVPGVSSPRGAAGEVDAGVGEEFAEDRVACRGRFRVGAEKEGVAAVSREPVGELVLLGIERIDEDNAGECDLRRRRRRRHRRRRCSRRYRRGARPASWRRRCGRTCRP